MQVMKLNMKVHPQGSWNFVEKKCPTYANPKNVISYSQSSPITSPQ